MKNKIIATFLGLLAAILLFFIELIIVFHFDNVSDNYLLLFGYLCGVIFSITYFGYLNMKKNKLTILQKYNNSLKALYDHVGFTPDWVVYPIDDCTDSYWSTDGKHVKYAETIEKYNSDGDFYRDIVYTQRFYKKHIYRGKIYTMIFCDPRVDGMIYFSVFDNKKEQKT